MALVTQINVYPPTLSPSQFGSMLIGGRLTDTASKWTHVVGWLEANQLLVKKAWLD